MVATALLLGVEIWPARRHRNWHTAGLMQAHVQPGRAGVWVIAHECGHQAFSSSQLVNDTVGFILHTCLLVPYFSW